MHNCRQVSPDFHYDRSFHSISQLSHLLSKVIFLKGCDLNKSLPEGGAGFNHWFRDLSEPCKASNSQHPGVLLFSHVLPNLWLAIQLLLGQYRRALFSQSTALAFCRSLFLIYHTSTWPKGKRRKQLVCLMGTMVKCPQSSGPAEKALKGGQRGEIWKNRKHNWVESNTWKAHIMNPLLHAHLLNANFKNSIKGK